MASDPARYALRMPQAHCAARLSVRLRSIPPFRTVSELMFTSVAVRGECLKSSKGRFGDCFAIARMPLRYVRCSSG